MEKPKKFIYRSEGSHYSIMGDIHIGRVSMPVAIPLTLTGILLVVLFIVSVATFQVLPAVSAAAGIGAGIIVIGFVVGLIAWGIVALINWMKSSIRVDRPGE